MKKDGVAYYNSYALHRKLDDCDLDSVEAYEKFAKDHYGELGFSRMNVGATKYYAGGKWIITFGISYSAYVDVGLKIAMALYETGAPVVFHDAGNLLHILEESGKVRLTPFTFHDYLEGGDDEGVDRGDKSENALIKASIDEIAILLTAKCQQNLTEVHLILGPTLKVVTNYVFGFSHCFLITCYSDILSLYS